MKKFFLKKDRRNDRRKNSGQLTNNLGLSC